MSTLVGAMEAGATPEVQKPVENQRETTAPKPHLVTIVLASISPVLAAVAIILSYGSLQTSQKSLETSQQSMKVAQRAYVTAENFKATLKELQFIPSRRILIRVDYSFTLRNLGNTPATVKKFTITPVSGMWGAPGPQEFIASNRAMSRAKYGDYMLKDPSQFNEQTNEIASKSQQNFSSFEFFAIGEPESTGLLQQRARLDQREHGLTTAVGNETEDTRTVILVHVAYSDVFQEEHKMDWRQEVPYNIRVFAVPPQDWISKHM
jgi:hypothetical protein